MVIVFVGIEIAVAILIFVISSYILIHKHAPKMKKEFSKLHDRAHTAINQISGFTEDDPEPFKQQFEQVRSLSHSLLPGINSNLSRIIQLYGIFGNDGGGDLKQKTSSLWKKLVTIDKIEQEQKNLLWKVGIAESLSEGLQAIPIKVLERKDAIKVRIRVVQDLLFSLRKNGVSGEILKERMHKISTCANELIAQKRSGHVSHESVERPGC